MANRRSRYLANNDSVNVSTRYSAATVNQISNVAKVLVITSRPALVRSVMAMTETSDESLISDMNCPASAGSTRRRAEWNQDFNTHTINIA